MIAYDTMSSRADGVSRSSGEHDEAIRQLIAVGEEKGYLHREEIDTVLPPEITASSVLDDLLSQCRDAGIDVDSESLEGELLVLLYPAASKRTFPGISKTGVSETPSASGESQSFL